MATAGKPVNCSTTTCEVTRAKTHEIVDFLNLDHHRAESGAPHHARHSHPTTHHHPVHGFNVTVAPPSTLGPQRHESWVYVRVLHTESTSLPATSPSRCSIVGSFEAQDNMWTAVSISGLVDLHRNSKAPTIARYSVGSHFCTVFNLSNSSCFVNIRASVSLMGINCLFLKCSRPKRFCNCSIYAVWLMLSIPFFLL